MAEVKEGINGRGEGRDEGNKRGNKKEER